MKIVALAGGVGGAKMVDGFSQVLDSGELTVIVNIGDDFEHFGLKICPDLDTVCYTLCGKSNQITGWGRENESYVTLDEIKILGGDDWFLLGDKDLGIHIMRSYYLSQGKTLSEITKIFCDALGAKAKVLPVTNDNVPTIIQTKEGKEISFQEYFVHQKCEPALAGVRFHAIHQAKPAPGVIEALEDADYVIICPSNPWVSIAPILGIPGIKNVISTRRTLAISPIIGGKAIKGPAAKMYAEMGIKPSAVAVADTYRSVIQAFVLDSKDSAQISEINDRGIITLVTDTIMKDRQDRGRLAKEIIHFCNNAFSGIH